MYNILVVGCGNIGGLRENDDPNGKYILTHCHAIYKARKKKNVDQFFIYDKNESQLKKALIKWNAIDYELMSVIEKIDIVIIAVPTEHHYKIAKDILKINPKLVIIEKPFCKTYDQAIEIHNLYQEKNIPLVINYPRRYCVDLVEGLTAIRSGIYGKIIHAKMAYTRGLKRDGCHALDIFNMAFGNFIDGEILNKQNAITDYHFSDPSYTVYLEYEKCNNVFLIPADGREYSIFDLEIITAKGKIIFSEHFRKMFFYPARPEPIYGNFKTLCPYYTTSTEYNIENMTLELLYDCINYLDQKNRELKSTSENALEIHKIYNKLGV